MYINIKAKTLLCSMFYSHQNMPDSLVGRNVEHSGNDLKGRDEKSLVKTSHSLRSENWFKRKLQLTLKSATLLFTIKQAVDSL